MTTPTHPTPQECPSLAEMAAFVDNQCSLAERTRIIAHVAGCRLCISWLAGIARTMRTMAASLPTNHQN